MRLLTLLGVAGVTYVMGVPGADDVMLSYQSTSFHDALYLRGALGLRPAPEFDAWLAHMGITAARHARAHPRRPVTHAHRSRLMHPVIARSEAVPDVIREAIPITIADR